MVSTKEPDPIGVELPQDANRALRVAGLAGPSAEQSSDAQRFGVVRTEDPRLVVKQLREHPDCASGITGLAVEPRALLSSEQRVRVIGPDHEFLFLGEFRKRRRSFARGAPLPTPVRKFVPGRQCAWMVGAKHAEPVVQQGRKGSNGACGVTRLALKPGALVPNDQRSECSGPYTRTKSSTNRA